MMKAAVLREPGGPEVLKIEDIKRPEPGKGEVLIRVHATSVNHLDIWIRKGLTAYGTKYPHILGADIAGIIEEVGPDVQGFRKGDRVFVDPGLRCFRCESCLSGNDNICRSFGIIGATIKGGYAEYAIVPEINVLRLPETIDFKTGAAFPLTYQTSWHMLIGRAGLRPGETVLVIGGASGIGIAAIQIAKLTGAFVIATAGDERKLEIIKTQGADYVINHSRESIYEKVKTITPEGVDVVFEHVGPATLMESIRSLRKGGRLVICGATTGPEVTVDLRYFFSRQLSILGSIMGTRAELIKITSLVEKGLLKPVIDSVFPLDEVSEAHRKMEDRKIAGKIIIVP
jgi:NADPH:quinone reductase-like Zn-dependent oxidoreductase